MSDEQRHSGTWQAQGDDVRSKGHLAPWAQTTALTKVDGLRLLAELKDLCTAAQRDMREKVCSEATRYVKRAPAAGISGFHMKSFTVKSPPTSARKARIDLEIIVGQAFSDSSDSKGHR